MLENKKNDENACQFTKKQYLCKPIIIRAWHNML